MSLDGKRDTHDWFRKPGSFDTTIEKICMAENMVLQATELGIASCIISRGEETFDSEEGRKLTGNWGVSENYSCQAFVILGYINGIEPHTKPRRSGRIKIVE